MADHSPRMRMRVTLHGVVQGVGFRPFVYRLAGELKLSGWTANSAQGLEVEVEGAKELLDDFLLRLPSEKPPRAVIQGLEYSILDPEGFRGFEIRDSNGAGDRTALVPPDIAVCPACVGEINDPENRRYRYPFTNCTNCGPRFSIITRLPYDRGNTTMRGFEMCADCSAEYEDPSNRRFHAQPNACPACGPRLALWDSAGRTLERDHAALVAAARVVRDGGTAALKGLGGFQLIADARNEDAVRRLRTAKDREEKPFAIMLPDIEKVRALCEFSALEERALSSPESPIVLLKRREGSQAEVSAETAPGNPRLGVMLPYTPLHHLLLRELKFPVIATSGNRSEEPMVTREEEALEKLGGIADVFLVHDRPIARHVDDSIVEVALGREAVRRRARGYAPIPLLLDREGPSILAVGAYLKNTVAVSSGRRVFLSSHVGDLETPAAVSAFGRTAEDLKDLCGVSPEAVACDLHPDFPSTRFALKAGLPLFKVQHHWAHVISCAAENRLEGRFLGVSWDGTGFGPDGSVWGGEFLSPRGGDFERRGHLRVFRLPGSEAAVREPRRSALGVMHALFGGEIPEKYLAEIAGMFEANEMEVMIRMLERGVNSPWTSSAGRLFDAVSAVCGFCTRSRFEGQAAMALEFAASSIDGGEPYAIDLAEDGNGFVLDWKPLLLSIIEDRIAKVSTGIIAAKFHDALAESIVSGARRCGLEKVVLSGGCFQNRRLLESAVRRLGAEGFRPYWHQRVPTNDGGISLGQAAARLYAGKGA